MLHRPIETTSFTRSRGFRGKLFCVQINDQAGFLFVFVVMLFFGLYAVTNPKAVKKENEDVPGFHKTGFSWMPVWAWRLFGIALLAVSGIFLYLFLRHSPSMRVL